MMNGVGRETTTVTATTTPSDHYHRPAVHDDIIGNTNTNIDNNSNNDWYDLESELDRDADSFVDILHPQNASENGSTQLQAIFNFTNCIIGAGAIGLGNAIADSGGFISIFAISFFAFLVKLSLDLLLSLSLSFEQNANSYEELGLLSFGHVGKLCVIISKFAYSFGCLVAYIVVIKDNAGQALQNLLFQGGHEQNNNNWFYWFLGQNILNTWVLSAMVVLPLCMLRDMTPLSNFSILSVFSMISIVVIVIYLWYIDDIDNNVSQDGMSSSSLVFPSSSSSSSSNEFSQLSGNNYFPWYYAMAPQAQAQDEEEDAKMLAQNSTSFYEHWLKIRWGGLLDNMGTFVFTFVCQHTAHLTFDSLKPELRTLNNWKHVSTWSILSSCLVSVLVGIFVYMTFWEKTESDIFEIYPDSNLLDSAKLLLCLTMLLTFPLPFFACRELLILFFFPFAAAGQQQEQQQDGDDDNNNAVAVATTDNDIIMEDDNNDLEEPLLTTAASASASSSQSNGSDEDGAGNNKVAEEQQHQQSLEAPVHVERYDADDDDHLGYTSLTPSFLRSESVDLSVLSTRAIQVMNSFLVPGEERQLKWPYHVGVTFKLWFVATGLAIAAPNLGDVLDLVGCFSGTLIAFILPGCFAIRLQGYSHQAALILVVGTVCGIVGTICSLKQFLQDAFHAH